MPKLLLIEDNKIALFTLEHLLTQAGLKFMSVMDAEAALKLLAARSFDLIITDIGLPGISGIELAYQICLLKKEMKMPQIIGLTAHSEEQIKTQCLQAGMSEVCTKPITLDTLLRIKAQYLGSGHALAFANAACCGQPVDLTAIQQELLQLERYSLFDAEHALKDMGGDINLLKNILKSIIEKETPSDVSALKCAHASGDWCQIEKLAHRIKSGFIYCGSSKLVHVCQCVEHHAKTGHHQLMELLYQHLLLVLEETKNKMGEWLLQLPMMVPN